MKSVKCLFVGGVLTLLGPIMHCLDVSFSGFHLLCWVVGIPVFVLGLLLPVPGKNAPLPSESLPQKECPDCGKQHDFDYPRCPYCGYDYQAKSVC